MTFSECTLADVVRIVELIRALRHVAKDSKVQTHKTQSKILRDLTPAVLCAVALELDKDSPSALRKMLGGAR